MFTYRTAYIPEFVGERQKMGALNPLKQTTEVVEEFVSRGWEIFSINTSGAEQQNTVVTYVTFRKAV